MVPQSTGPLTLLCGRRAPVRVTACRAVQALGPCEVRAQGRRGAQQWTEVPFYPSAPWLWAWALGAWPVYPEVIVALPWSSVLHLTVYGFLLWSFLDTSWMTSPQGPSGSRPSLHPWSARAGGLLALAPCSPQYLRDFQS